MRVLSAFYLVLSAAFVAPVVAMTHQSTQHSSSVTQAHITLSDFWARASIGMAPNSGAYGQIVSTRDDRLISARTPAAAIVEIHEHIKDQGVMRMREVPGGLQIPANQPVLMAPGGYHIMLINVISPLQADSTIPLTLEFEQAGTVELTVPVRGIMPAHQGSPGGMKGHGH